MTRSKFDWRNDMKIFSDGPRFWVQTLKKKEIRFLPSNPKRNPPPPNNVHNVFRADYCHTFFPGISERTGGIGESFARSWAGHERQMISCPQRWCFSQNPQRFKTPWYLEALASGYDPVQIAKESPKKSGGWRWCGKFGRIACGVVFFFASYEFLLQVGFCH